MVHLSFPSLVCREMRADPSLRIVGAFLLEFAMSERKLARMSRGRPAAPRHHCMQRPSNKKPRDRGGSQGLNYSTRQISPYDPSPRRAAQASCAQPPMAAHRLAQGWFAAIRKQRLSQGRIRTVLPLRKKGVAARYFNQIYLRKQLSQGNRQTNCKIGVGSTR
jgi:hypothetical protein